MCQREKIIIIVCNPEPILRVLPKRYAEVRLRHSLRTTMRLSRFRDIATIGYELPVLSLDRLTVRSEYVEARVEHIRDILHRREKSIFELMPPPVMNYNSEVLPRLKKNEKFYDHYYKRRK